MAILQPPSDDEIVYCEHVDQDGRTCGRTLTSRTSRTVRCGTVHYRREGEEETGTAPKAWQLALDLDAPAEPEHAANGAK